MAADSKYQDIMTIIIAGVTAISSIKKVYDYISDLGDGQPYPRAEVLVGDETLKAKDSNCEVWDAEFMVLLNAYAAPDEIEDVIHELRKYAVTLAKLYVNDSSHRWNIVRDEGIKVSRLMITDKIVWSQVRFMVHSRYMDTNL